MTVLRLKEVWQAHKCVRVWSKCIKHNLDCVLIGYSTLNYLFCYLKILFINFFAFFEYVLLKAQRSTKS